MAISQTNQVYILTHFLEKTAIKNTYGLLRTHTKLKLDPSLDVNKNIVQCTFVD